MTIMSPMNAEIWMITMEAPSGKTTVRMEIIASSIDEAMSIGMHWAAERAMSVDSIRKSCREARHDEIEQMRRERQRLLI